MSSQQTEAEIKLRVSSATAARLQTRLQETGSAPIKHLDVYFDTRDRDFTSQDPVAQWLSIRIRERVHINHKLFTYDADGSTSDCTETDVVVESSQGATSLLTALGYSEVVRVEKTRTSAVVDDIVVAVDVVDHLGFFVELESLASDAGYTELTQRLLAFAESLDLGEWVIDSKGYPYLMLNR